MVWKTDKRVCKMRYTALILKHFKRFALNQISLFDLRPTEQIQLILGTNGSGKSSLLGELTPLPANAADYLKGGSKEIHISHRGSTYVLISSFESGNKHYFRKDDEELNPGGTQAVQKELCKQEFGVTPDTHELSTGLLRFTGMGPSHRREWYTRMSDVSFDYAIGVYDKLRKEHRSVVGALDLDKKQLVTEQSKIITEEEQQLLVNDVKDLHRELERLLEIKRRPDRPMDVVEEQRRLTERDLLELSNKLLNLKVESPAHLYRDEWGILQPLEFKSIDGVNAYIDDLREQIAAQNAVMEKLVADHSKQKDTVEVLKKQGADGIESVRKKINEWAEKRVEAMKGLRLKLDFSHTDPVQAKRTIEAIKHDLEALVFELPVNTSKTFGSAVLGELKQSAQTLKDQHRRKVNEQAQLSARKQHAEEHREKGVTTCPKCNHSFHMGMSDAQMDELKKRLVIVGQEIEKLEEHLKKLEAAIAEQEEYGARYRAIIQLTRSTPALKPFWEYVAEKELLVNAPRSVMSTMQILENDVDLECMIDAMNAEIEELKKLLAKSEELGDQNLGEAVEKLNTLTTEIEAHTKALAQSRRELNDFHTYRKQLQEAMALELKINVAMVTFENLTHEAVETLRLSTIEQCFRQTQSTLARKEEVLKAVHQQKAIVEHLKTTIVRRTMEEEALKHCVRELSPTDGLIAEGLLGFIKNFTHQMNQLIRKIWAYPLEVLPCGISSERGAELDYKFPLMVGTRDNIVSDVSRGSSGMQEIVDLAFKVIGLKYLGLEHGTLMLDEFGKTLDLEHRTAAVMAIKMLMETKPFSQLFMISHYESHYGAFSNAQVCVLDARNIAVPKTHNTHVTIQ
jgi:DNA repair exonuclease SbcCD ATPase subunit